MRGVIIWHCATTRQAVVWCDDSGDLAYAKNVSCWRQPAEQAAVGDYVAFELSGKRVARLCTGIEVLASGHAPGLANVLKADPVRRDVAAPRLRACA